MTLGNCSNKNTFGCTMSDNDQSNRYCIISSNKTGSIIVVKAVTAASVVEIVEVAVAVVEVVAVV